MSHKSITTPVLTGYRIEGNCNATSFLAGCQIFDPELRASRSELIIFNEEVLKGSDSKQEFRFIVDWLNQQNYDYLIIDPDTNDEVWDKVKEGKLLTSIQNSEESPYSVKDIQNLVRKGFCVIPSVHDTKGLDIHAVLVYKDINKHILKDPETNFLWKRRKFYPEHFQDRYFLQNNPDRFLIAFKH